MRSSTPYTPAGSRHVSPRDPATSRAAVTLMPTVAPASPLEGPLSEVTALGAPVGLDAPTGVGGRRSETDDLRPDRSHRCARDLALCAIPEPPERRPSATTLRARGSTPARRSGRLHRTRAAQSCRLPPWVTLVINPGEKHCGCERARQPQTDPFRDRRSLVRDGFGSTPPVGARRTSPQGGAGRSRAAWDPWASCGGLRRAQRARPRVRVGGGADYDLRVEADEEGAAAFVRRRSRVRAAGESRLAAPRGSRLTWAGSHQRELAATRAIARRYPSHDGFLVRGARDDQAPLARERRMLAGATDGDRLRGR
jgi:hypothetical protein